MFLVNSGRKAASGLPKGLLARIITTTAQEQQPVAQAAAPAAKPALYKDFQIYRWNPDEPEQPKYVNYKLDINRLVTFPGASGTALPSLAFRVRVSRAARLCHSLAVLIGGRVHGVLAHVGCVGSSAPCRAFSHISARLQGCCGLPSHPKT